MENIISAYLWGYKNYEAGVKSIETFRKFYAANDVFVRIDIDGDLENYKNKLIPYNVDISLHSSKIGYPGNFLSSGYVIGRDCWEYHNLYIWLKSIYDCCKKTSAKYMIILEEDVFILKEISIIKTEFGIAIIRNKNKFPNRITKFIIDVGGNIITDGYGACGGCIINTKSFIKGFDNCIEILKSEFDDIRKYTKLVGWSDMMLQVIVMCGMGSVIINEQLVEPWMQEKNWINDSWKNYEIVNYLKNISEL